SPVSSEQEVSFTSEAQLTAATKPGYAYGLAEVRGSTATPLAGSVAAYYDADGAGADSSEALITANDKGWYIQTFAATGVITFKNLTPGKVYRIVGIPAAAISPALNVNERPEYVLDEGYYADMRILPVSAGDTETVWNIDLEAVGMKARATIKNARSDVEYALLDSAGGGVALAHEWTNWTTSDSKGRVRFNNLTLDTVYYLVVRPLGYGEVTYAEAAEAAVKVRTPSHPDLSVANIARPNYTTITIANTSSGYDYAAVDTKTGQIVEQKHGLDNTTLRFENLDERKAYQVVIRRAGGSWLKGVRVYPYPSKLYIDYVNETVRSSADSTGNIPVNVEYRIQKKKK
ncbi:MAG: hypothetical protein LBF89_01445, partial [Bacteroidales bacterium]|nr:hypothetical protein [Bacteroidales bacterium]